jgi:hypothetical protein
VVAEEPLAHEKLCPVLGVLRVPTAARGIEAARAVLRIGGSGHSAAIHSTDPATILAYGAALRVLRISVNAGASLGGAGLETNLAPSMTIGTGFVGRSSMGENLNPRHLVQPVRLAWNADASVPLPPLDLSRLWTAPGGPVPAYPRASNEHVPAVQHREPVSTEAAELREEIRRLVVEELRAIVRG